MMRNLVLVVLCWAAIGNVGAQSTPAVDWSGFYLSGGLGGAANSADVDTTVDAGSVYLNTTDVRQLAGVSSGNLSEGAVAGGIAAGYGWHFGQGLIGIEASANSLGFNATRSVGEVYQSAPPAQFTLEQSVKADWMATIRARLGWAQDRWLAYVTGGLAMTQVKFNTSFRDNFVFGGFTGAGGQGSTSESKLGWTLGLGGEYALTDKWSLKADYLYADFGSVTTSMLVTHPGTPDNSTLSSSAKLRTHVMLIGLSYRFD